MSDLLWDVFFFNTFLFFQESECLENLITYKHEASLLVKINLTSGLRICSGFRTFVLFCHISSNVDDINEESLDFSVFLSLI